jgi:uncharacterized repeat protein (TIGR03803 family)
MQKLSSGLVSIPATIFASFVLSAILSTNTGAQTFEVLHNFGVAAGDGNEPYSPLTADPAGNLYGTTSTGGAHGLGTVYRLSPNASGGYNETILYSFKGGSADGAFPHAPLFRDAAGNFYSTTVSGGVTAAVCTEGAGVSPGCGVVFKLSPTGTGQWTETVLHRFTGSDGGNSFSGLVRDKAGNFYGATFVGGSHGVGVVFKLSLTSSGWKEMVLHNFAGGTDGAQPFIDCATLALDSNGHIFGSTYKGGSANAGTVFELTRQTSGAWTEKILYTFQGGTDGNGAFSGVIVDQSGNVYGTTLEGGTHNYGTVFVLTAAHGFAKTTLHNFDSFTDPAKGFPNALVFDASGNLWGTTEYVPFELTPTTSGWNETVFWGGPLNGDGPIFCPLLLDSKGNLYGVTLWGGQAGSTTGGVAFKITP